MPILFLRSWIPVRGTWTFVFSHHPAAEHEVWMGPEWVKISQSSLTKIWLFFSWLAVYLIAERFPLISRVLKKLALTIFASIFIAFVERWTIGVSYFARFGDISLWFMFANGSTLRTLGKTGHVTHWMLMEEYQNGDEPLEFRSEFVEKISRGCWGLWFGEQYAVIV